MSKDVTLTIDVAADEVAVTADQPAADVAAQPWSPVVVYPARRPGPG